ncbi:MAG: flagellar assembly protein FliW [Terriglobia bacterium]
MKLETYSFGTLEYDSQSIVELSEGMLGFARYKKYLLLEHEETQPLKWLQSLDSPEIAFPVVDPQLLIPDYADSISQEVLETLQIEQPADAVTLAVVVIPEDPSQATVNLKAPVLINHRKMTGIQIVLQETAYETQTPLSRIQQT